MNFDPQTEIKSKRLSVFEILQTTGYILRNNFRKIFLLCFIVQVLILTVSFFIPSDLIFYIDPGSTFTPTALKRLINVMVLSLGTQICFAPLITAGLTNICEKTLSGEKVTSGFILESTLLKWWKLAATALICTVLTLLGSILILPAIYFGIVFCFSTNVASRSNKWGASALTRSMAIISGRTIKTLGWLIVVLVIESISQVFLTFVLSFILGLIFRMAVVSSPGMVFFISVFIPALISAFCAVFPVILCVLYLNYEYSFDREMTPTIDESEEQ